jgi:hypothetical protein
MPIGRPFSEKNTDCARIGAATAFTIERVSQKMATCHAGRFREYLQRITSKMQLVQFCDINGRSRTRSSG